MEEEDLGPSRGYYVLAAAILVGGWVGFAFLLWTNLTGMEKKLQQVVMPGTVEINLRKAGGYTIFYEHRSVVGNRVYSTGTDLSGLECTLVSKASGARVPLSPATSSSNYEFGGRAGHSVFEFKIPEAGPYELTGGYAAGQAGPEVVLAVGQDFMADLFVTIFGSLALVFGSMAAGAVIIAVTAYKRHKARQLLKAHATSRIYSPGATS